MVDHPSSGLNHSSARLARDGKVMSSSLAIVTAVCFGAISALVSFAIDRNVFGGGAPLRPFTGDWELRGALAPADSLYRAPATEVKGASVRRQA